MDDKKLSTEEIIEKITDLKTKINEVIYERYPYSLKSNGIKILNLLRLLIEESEKEDIEEHMLWRYKEAKDALDHTLSKEVYFMEAKYAKSRKNNAAKIREMEYEEALQKAIDQINSDLSFLDFEY